MPSKKKRVSVVLPDEMVAQLKSRYGVVNAHSLRQAIADFFSISNELKHGGARDGAGRPPLHNFEE